MRSTGDVIDVSGVRLSLVGSGLTGGVTAAVSATGDVRLLGGSNRLAVINQLVDPLSDEDVDDDTVAELIRHTGSPTGMSNAFKLVITEPTVDAFAGANLNFELSGIPDGASVTVDAWVVTKDEFDDEDVEEAMRVDTGSFTTTDTMNDQVPVDEPGQMTATLTGEENTVVVLLSDMAAEFMFEESPDDDQEDLADATGSMLTSGRDVVILRGWLSFDDDDARDALLPLSLDIQATADLGPVGVKSPKGEQTTAIPRFDSDKTTAVTIIESTSAQVTMQVAYVIYDGTFDTGIAVANMTSGKTAQERCSPLCPLHGRRRMMEYSTGMLGPQSHDVDAAQRGAHRAAESHR